MHRQQHLRCVSGLWAVVHYGRCWRVERGGIPSRRHGCWLRHALQECLQEPGRRAVSMASMVSWPAVSFNPPSVEINIGYSAACIGICSCIGLSSFRSMHLIGTDFDADVHASRRIGRLWHMRARHCRLVRDL